MARTPETSSFRSKKQLRLWHSPHPCLAGLGEDVVLGGDSRFRRWLAGEVHATDVDLPRRLQTWSACACNEKFVESEQLSKHDFPRVVTNYDSGDGGLCATYPSALPRVPLGVELNYQRYMTRCHHRTVEHYGVSLEARDERVQLTRRRRGRVEGTVLRSAPGGFSVANASAETRPRFGQSVRDPSRQLQLPAPLRRGLRQRQIDIFGWPSLPIRSPVVLVVAVA